MGALMLSLERAGVLVHAGIVLAGGPPGGPGVYLPSVVPD